MVRQVLESSEKIASSVVEWKDATGWTEEMLYWLLAWIDVVEWKHGILRYGSETGSEKGNGKAKVWGHQRRDSES